MSSSTDRRVLFDIDSIVELVGGRAGDTRALLQAGIDQVRR